MGGVLENFCDGCRKEEDQNNIRGSYFIQDLGTNIPKAVMDLKVSTKNLIIQRIKNVFDIYDKICFLGKGALVLFIKYLEKIQEQD